MTCRMTFSRRQNSELPRSGSTARAIPPKSPLWTPSLRSSGGSLPSSEPSLAWGLLSVKLSRRRRDLLYRAQCGHAGRHPPPTQFRHRDLLTRRLRSQGPPFRQWNEDRDLFSQFRRIRFHSLTSSCSVFESSPSLLRTQVDPSHGS